MSEWLHGVHPIRGFERRTCYRILAYRGKGTEEDPHRNVVVWFTEDGEVISYVDAWADEQMVFAGAEASPTPERTP